MTMSTYIVPSQSSGFTYYYPDAHPTAFVSFLGAGYQGAAILVRSMVDGYERSETTNAIPHPNIPRLVAQTPLAGSAANLWAHCNGGSLADLVAKCKRRKEFVPELLVWQLIHDLLPTVLHLHDRGIAHADLVLDNIFVHWPTEAIAGNDAQSTPPKFLIGDFGCSYELPPDNKVKESIGISETSEAVYGDLADLAVCIDLIMRAGEVPRTPTAERADSHNCGFIDLRELVSLPSRREGSSRGDDYSRGLIDARKTLVSLAYRLEGFNVSRACDGELFSNLIAPLLRDIKTGLELEQLAKSKYDFEPLMPRAQKLARPPFTFQSREALLASPYQPPGPWCIAEVDREGKLVQAELQEKYCVSEVMVTKDGNEVGEEDVRDEWRQACW